jgi:hypothetical protein
MGGELGRNRGGVVAADLGEFKRRAVAVERGRQPTGQAGRQRAGAAQRRDRPGDRLLEAVRLGGGDLPVMDFKRPRQVGPFGYRPGEATSLM